MSDGSSPPAARLDLLQVGERLLEDGVLGNQDDDRHLLVDERCNLDEVAVGVRRVWAASDHYAMVADRRSAIFAALSWAEPGDAIVIAGKGHETYQIRGTTKLHFDEREIESPGVVLPPLEA